MKKKKTTVAVLFGGRSAEHEVSLRSARTVVAVIDPEKYQTILIGINRQGHWFLDDENQTLLKSDALTDQLVKRLKPPAKPQLADKATTPTELSPLPSFSAQKIDVLFPVLHGPYGEDGTVQGLAKLANIACVGPGVLGSAINMDKDVMKRLLRDAGIKIGKFETITPATRKEWSYEVLVKTLSEPLFIKPANLGSSVGVSKVTSAEELERALNQAFQYDRKVVVEEFIDGREIELSVLGNDTIEVSVPGEVIAGDAFYSYDAKYSSQSQSETKIPADLPEEAINKLQAVSKKAYQILECRGMARVDCFYTADGEVLVNELNTIPGFTSISMYPKLWEATGKPLPQLVDQLIQLALEDFATESNRLTE